VKRKTAIRIPQTRSRGASLIEYGALLGLLGAVGVSSLLELGGGISEFFTGAADRVAMPETYDPDAFVIEVQTSSATIFPMAGGAIEVDWGDEAANASCGRDFVAGASITCDYPRVGTYRIALTGNMTNYGANVNSPTNADITRVIQWGNTGLTSLNYAFQNASNLFDVPNNIPPTVEHLTGIFLNASSLNDADISNWDVGSVMYFSYAFQGASAFNQELADWDMGSAIQLHGMFQDASSFNKPIGSWDTSSVVNISGMFMGDTSFNQDISEWDVSSVVSMRSVFHYNNAFSGDISSWDVSNVSSMRAMFRSSNFNGDISSWDTSGATDMRYMFLENPDFDQDISGWDVGNVESFESMFLAASSFNQDISEWDTSSALNMDEMFSGASAFGGDLSSWCVTNFPIRPVGFSDGSSIAQEPIWGTCP